MTSAADPTAEDFANMGIDEVVIRKFVLHFYDVVHDDEILGHYFHNQMSATWDEHLDKMCNFWSAILLKTHRFNGRPMPAHTKLTGLQQSDFLHWLKTFEKSIKHCCTSEAVPHIMKKAHMIANSLQYGVFYKPEIMGSKLNLKN
ncbi:MAG: group III truncated hemoglobin [Rhizobiales bacterium]|nr:group III truncated hemoglobin [Hyphomicrobiales bacterium]